jgi:hypothetical protein
LRSCLAWLEELEELEEDPLAGALPVAAAGAELELPLALPPARAENSWPSFCWRSMPDELPDLDEDPLPPPPPAPVEVAVLPVELGEEPAELVLTSEALAPGLAGSLQAVVLGPGSPGGAPPGSGTQPPGFDGSGSLMPGWLGPSHE